MYSFLLVSSVVCISILGIKAVLRRGVEDVRNNKGRVRLPNSFKALPSAYFLIILQVPFLSFLPE